MVTTLTLPPATQGLHLITDRIAEVVQMAVGRNAFALSGPGRPGLCTIFIRHTSASLLIQENADPSARRDLEAWLNRLVPEHDKLFTHNDEGPDDMPSHIKAALTAVSLSIPIMNGQLALGRWQGIYLWEHRVAPHARELVIHIGA